MAVLPDGRVVSGSWDKTVRIWNPFSGACDLVLTGAEAVVENGGIVNKLGTYQIALCAKACNKPFYCAAESYKFARLYPLTQKVRRQIW